MSEARIRPIGEADVPRVHNLLRGLAEYEKMTDILTGTPEMLREALFGKAPRLEGLVAEREGKLVGYALFYPVFGSFRARWRLWLEDLYVEESERGAGTGAALMAELARITLERGWYSMDWEVIDWNEPALRFYQALGSNEVAKDWLRYRLSGDALQAVAGRAAAKTEKR
jgi:GNAT superfamily N-acetyltransferase